MKFSDRNMQMVDLCIDSSSPLAVRLGPVDKILGLDSAPREATQSDRFCRVAIEPVDAHPPRHAANGQPLPTPPRELIRVPLAQWEKINLATGEFQLPDGVFELLRLAGVCVALELSPVYKLYYTDAKIAKTYVCTYRIGPTMADWADACRQLLAFAQGQAGG